MPKRVLTAAERDEYRDALRDGVPEAVVVEFIEALDQHMTRWEAKLRRALKAGATQAILTERENAATDDDDA